MGAGAGTIWRYRSVARSDRGRVRSRNEDSVVDRPDIGLWAVADGMGGHKRGDRASGIVREELTSLNAQAGIEAMLDAARERVAAAHARVRAELGGSVSGSTVVVLTAAGDRFGCLWAGDSRLYRCSADGVTRLTRDHSLVEELVGVGVIAPEAARRHPLANRITRAVGVEDGLDLDACTGTVGDGDRFLLTSDGLHGLIEDAVVAQLAALDDLDAAADALLKAALDAGGTDNVSLVLVAAQRAAAAAG